MAEKDNEQSSSGGFAKTTDFKWLGIGLAIFALIAFIMPMPDSMVLKAEELFKGQAGVDVAMKAKHIKIIIALLSTCVIFFATEAVPMPAVALLIGLVQLLFGITDSRNIVGTYAHDAVWFIAGSLALGATLVKYGLDKRVGMLVINLAGTKTRMIVIGILLGTAIPTAFVGEHAVAAMYVPIAMALYTLTNKSTPAPRLGTLLMVTIAVGCMIGGPMSPTGGARNALMIGFLADYGIEVSFMQWVSMGIFYTACMSVVMAFILPLLFKPEVSDLSEAVGLLKKDLEKHGAMTGKQKLVALIMLAVVVLWIVDKSVTGLINSYIVAYESVPGKSSPNIDTGAPITGNN